MRKLCLLSVTVLPLLTLAGCGSSSSAIKVTGKVVLPAKVSLQEGDSLSLSFVPMEKSGKSAVGTVDPKDLTFTTDNLLPGNYRIGAKFQAYPGSKEGKKRDQQFAGINKSLEPSSSPMTYEVTSTSKQEITVDLDKKTVTKNK
jgi:hypothetical protein